MWDTLLFNSELEKWFWGQCSQMKSAKETQTTFFRYFRNDLWFCSWELWFSNYGLPFFLRNSLILDFLIFFILIRIWELGYPFPTMLRVWIWKANQCCRRNISTIDIFQVIAFYTRTIYTLLSNKSSWQFQSNILFRWCANQSEKLWKFSIENWSHFSRFSRSIYLKTSSCVIITEVDWYSNVMQITLKEGGEIV